MSCGDTNFIFSGDRREVYHYFKAKLLESKPEYRKKFQQFEEITDETTADFDDLEFWAPYVSHIHLYTTHTYIIQQTKEFY